jgi:hypothetical protein
MEEKRIHHFQKMNKLEKYKKYSDKLKEAEKHPLPGIDANDYNIPGLAEYYVKRQTQWPNQHIWVWSDDLLRSLRADIRNRISLKELADVFQLYQEGNRSPEVVEIYEQAT